jgi:hypothetical protein
MMRILVAYRAKQTGSFPDEASSVITGKADVLAAPKPHLRIVPQEMLVHRSRQKIHPSLAAHAMLPRLQPYQGADRVNLLNASVH